MLLLALQALAAPWYGCDCHIVTCISQDFKDFGGLVRALETLELQ